MKTYLLLILTIHLEFIAAVFFYLMMLSIVPCLICFIDLIRWNSMPILSNWRCFTDLITYTFLWRVMVIPNSSWTCLLMAIFKESWCDIVLSFVSWIFIAAVQEPRRWLPLLPQDRGENKRIKSWRYISHCIWRGGWRRSDQYNMMGGLSMMDEMVLIRRKTRTTTQQRRG